MSLGDMYKKVTSAGAGAFNDARGRMMQEKQSHDKMMESRELDRTKQMISHKKLEYQKVQGNVQRVRRELLHLRTGRKDTQTLSLIRSMESELRTLESEARTIDSDIRMKNLDVQRHGGMSF
jgi:predicted  nucleic acid-binding Zn-ribbon protein